jgi:hypothetical protein
MLPSSKLIIYIVDQLDYFRSHPKHLAWAMMNFEILRRAEIMNGIQSQNLIHEILCGMEDDDTDKALLKAAWDICSVSNYIEFKDTNPNIPIEDKPNKTLDDWISVFTNKHHRDSDSLTTIQEIINFILCTTGNGLKWNTNGYLAEMINSVDKIIFAGYTRITNIKKDIQDTIEKIMDVEELEDTIKKIKHIASVNADNNKAEKRFVNNEASIENIITKARSEKLKKKMRDAFRFICYFETFIDDTRDWSEEQWKEAVKKDEYEYKGVTFKISEIGTNYCTSLEQFKENIYQTVIKKTLSLPDYRINPFYRSTRYHMWLDFVYEITDLHDNDVKKALSILSKKTKLKDIALNRESVEKEKLKDKQNAIEVINAHRPNLEIYYPLLTIASKYGDIHAMKTLDEVAKVPEKGWDTIWYYAFECENDIGKHIWAHIDRELPVLSRKYSKLTEYSNIVTMPINAHHSYIKAGIKIAKEITNNPDEPLESDCLARKFLQKHLPQLLNKKIKGGTI